MKHKILTTLLLTSFFVGCSTTPLDVKLNEEAKNVLVKEDKPQNNYELISSISVSNGKGCRDFGYLGTKEDALKELKNKTKQLGGDYAQVTNVSKPHLDGGCYVNEYEIQAIIYKKVSSKPKALHVEKSIEEKDEELFTKKMRELKSLLDDGVLTQKEYDGQKAKLLDSGFSAK